MPNLGIQPDGSVIHYPLAMADMIRSRLAVAREQGEHELHRTVERIDGILEWPISQYRPLPAAKRFHTSKKKFRFCIGGNRSSKSHSVAHEVYWFATGTHPFKKIEVPNTGWYATITWDMVGTILWEKMQTLFSHMVQGEDYRVIWHNRNKGIPDTIFVKVGENSDGSPRESKIIFKAYEQGADSFQGTERRYVGFDEQFPEAVYTESISRIGANTELDFFTAMTPIKPQPWLEENLTIDTPESWDVFEYPLDDNRISVGGFIPDEQIDALIEEWPEEVAPTRRYGKWGSFFGSVYKSFSRQTHVVPEDQEHLFFPRRSNQQFLIPSPDRFSFGTIDWGGANPFVFLWGTRIPHMDDAWYIYDEYYWDSRTKGPRLIADHAKEITNRTLKHWKTRFARVWSDHDAQDRFEMANAGIPSFPAVKDVSAGIETVQTYMKLRGEFKRPRLFIAARCVNTIREHAVYKYSDPTETHDSAEEPVKKDDHTVDALRYMLHSEEVGVPRTKTISVPGSQRRF